MAHITYSMTGDAWDEYVRLVERQIVEHGSVKVCEVGGGANPQLTPQFVSAHGLEYTILDISEQELKKAPESYTKLIGDIAAKDNRIVGGFDLIFTKMLAEHVQDGRKMHQNIHALLRPGGVAVHFFPTLYAPPFLVNKLIPGNFAEILLDIVSPRDHYQFGKFRAYYDWCFGPTKPLLNMLEGLGFEIVEFRAFYGHDGYYRRLPLIGKIHHRSCTWLVHHPNPYLTSYAQVILRKLG